MGCYTNLDVVQDSSSYVSVEVDESLFLQQLWQGAEEQNTGTV